jgi:uncharacterized protein YdeI (YjbR/CyaY-like superfamily)
MSVRTAKPRFFRSAATFRRWLAKNHSAEPLLWVGFWRKGSGRPSITWPESVDVALCFRWIDGLRQGVDARRYRVRFTPRKPGSTWSAVNIRRARALAAGGLMHSHGLEAFRARRANRSGIYSYERRRDAFDPPYANLLKRNPAAWRFFRAQPPGYRRTVVWWVVSAKRETTRTRRLQRLIRDCAAQRRLAGFNRK